MLVLPAHLRATPKETQLRWSAANPEGGEARSVTNLCPSVANVSRGVTCPLTARVPDSAPLARITVGRQTHIPQIRTV